VWPSVIDYFGQYYWAMFGGGVDPEARTRLPLSTEKAGALLATRWRTRWATRWG
jgi:hypothetical protein